MKFRDTIGHSSQKELLRSLVDEERIPHAVLLYGPSGIGKTKIARAFLQYINCQNKSGGDSCGVCPACLQTAKLNNPDIHYVYPIVSRNKDNKKVSEDYASEWRQMLESNEYMPYDKWLDIIEANNSQPQIQVEESKEILRISSLSSFAARYKIFLIWLPEKLNKETANKLLKVIEEPHDDTLFILVSNEPSSILPTIRSRLYGIEFKHLSENEFKDWLNSKGLKGQTAEEIARLSRGNINKAEYLLANHAETAEFLDIFINVMRMCYARNIVKIKEIADKNASFGREKSLSLLDYFAGMVRESFISNLKQPLLNVQTDKERAFTAKFSPFIHTGNVEKISEEISKAKNDISRNANQKIVWFDLLLTLMFQLHIKED